MLQKAIDDHVFLQEDEDKKQAILRWLKFADGNVQVLKDYPEDLWNASYVQDFLKAYAAMAAALTNGYRIDCAIGQAH